MKIKTKLRLTGMVEDVLAFNLIFVAALLAIVGIFALLAFLALPILLCYTFQSWWWLIVYASYIAAIWIVVQYKLIDLTGGTDEEETEE